MRLYGQIREVLLETITFSYDDIDIDFKIGKSNSAATASAEIKIYNLGQADIAKIKKDSTIFVRAGYKNYTNIIFAGTIDDIKTIDEVNDIVTTIKANEDIKTIQETQFNNTYTQGVTASEIIDSISQKSIFGKGTVDLKYNVKYSKGKTFFCSLKKACEILATDTGTLFTVDNKKINFLRTDKTYKKTVNISGDRGLLKISSTDKDKFIMQTLMITDIEPGVIVNVEDRFFPGKYKVVNCTYTATGSKDFSIFSVLEAV